jgi:hypothetical protein
MPFRRWNRSPAFVSEGFGGISRRGRVGIGPKGTVKLRPYYARLMPQYAVIGRHEANGCPMNSKAAREIAMKAYGGMEAMLNAKHIKLVSDLHLDPNHLAFMLFEAPNAEVVRDLLMESGLGSFLDCNLHLVTPIPELLKRVGEMPTFYP